MNRVLIAIVLLLLLMNQAVMASDGVFEINDNCAVIEGCFTGDNPGYPVTITASGSYRLTGNLRAASVNTTLIQVISDDVTIDLNGFALIGPINCSGVPNVCNSSGTGVGILATTPSISVTVTNGTVQGMGSNGIDAGEDSIVENVRLIRNAGNGLQFRGATGSLAKNVLAKRNGGDGILIGFGGHYVLESTLVNNTQGGVFGGFCSNTVMSGNAGRDSCTGVGPNFCSPATNCD